jgi:hypothetical protein
VTRKELNWRKRRQKTDEKRDDEEREKEKTKKKEAREFKISTATVRNCTSIAEPFLRCAFNFNFESKSKS